MNGRQHSPFESCDQGADGRCAESVSQSKEFCWWQGLAACFYEVDVDIFGTGKENASSTG
jgi:hypothetical protein